MKKIFFFLAIWLAVQAQAQDYKPEGTWVGTLNLEGISLRLVLNVVRQKDGSLLTTVDSPDQGAVGKKTDTFSVKGNTLTFSAFAATFVGKFSKDGQQVVGNLTQGAASFPVTLIHRSKPLDYRRRQDPKPPFPYTSEDVVYKNGQQGNTLAGTITVPKGKGPFPAVVLITGSGAQNRNEEILGHRPFLVIADYLTRRGIAVLRVDDRGVGGSSGNVSNSTTADFVTDVLSGVGLVKKRSDIDPRRIGLIGHSEGGIIAPMAAAQSDDVAFIVMMAGTGMTGKELLPLQSAAIQRASGVPAKEIDQGVDATKKMLDVLTAEPDSGKARSKMRAIWDASLAEQPPAERAKVKNPDLAFAMAVMPMMTPWFRYFLTLDPIPFLEKVKCPVLAINGSLDMQVPAKANLPLIDGALKRGGNSHYVVKELPRLNHLFQTAKTGAPTEYATTDETISPAALKLMGDWISSSVSIPKTWQSELRQADK